MSKLARLADTYRLYLGETGTGDTIEDLADDKVEPSVNAVRALLAAVARAKLELLMTLEIAGLLRRPQ